MVYKLIIISTQQLPPPIDHMFVRVLDPPEAFPQRSFHFRFHVIHSITSNSLLSLYLWVIKAPTFWTFLHFLHFHLFLIVTIICTIASQILHISWKFPPSCVATFFSAWSGSEFHGWIIWKEEKMFKVKREYGETNICIYEVRKGGAKWRNDWCLLL